MLNVFLDLTKIIFRAAVKASWLLFGLMSLSYVLTGTMPTIDFKVYALAYAFGFTKAMDEGD